MQKDDNTPSAGTKADSEQKAEDIFASGNDTKPNVVGLPSLSGGVVGFVTAPNEEVVEKAKADAARLFPNNIVAQRNYWLDKGCSTMSCGIMSR
jgi:hypothetical protein